MLDQASEGGAKGERAKNGPLPIPLNSEITVVCSLPASHFTFKGACH